MARVDPLAERLQALGLREVRVERKRRIVDPFGFGPGPVVELTWVSAVSPLAPDERNRHSRRVAAWIQPSYFTDDDWFWQIAGAGGRTYELRECLARLGGRRPRRGRAGSGEVDGPDYAGAQGDDSDDD